MSELVKRSSSEVDPAEAKRFAMSRLMPEHVHKDPASVELMMRIGASLGIDPTSAFQHVYVFKDSKNVLKASLSAHLMVALALAAGHRVHVEGDAVMATATLIRKTSDDELRQFQSMREDERRQKLALLSDMKDLYDLQRQQILDRIADLKELAALDEKSSVEEVASLRKQLAGLHGEYDFESLRKAVTNTKFDLSRILRFESEWTLARARKITGLTDKSTWVNYGPEMLKNRAKATVVRDGAPDVILGIRNFMSTLGVMFSGERDDELAMANAAYTPDELGVDTDEEGAPLKGVVIDVTAERARKKQANMEERARKAVEKMDAGQLLNWAENEAGNDKLEPEDRVSRIRSVLDAVHEAGMADELVSRNGEEATLSAQMENVINNIPG